MKLTLLARIAALGAALTCTAQAQPENFNDQFAPIDGTYVTYPVSPATRVLYAARNTMFALAAMKLSKQPTSLLLPAAAIVGNLINQDALQTKRHLKYDIDPKPVELSSRALSAASVATSL